MFSHFTPHLEVGCVLGNYTCPNEGEKIKQDPSKIFAQKILRKSVIR